MHVGHQFLVWQAAKLAEEVVIVVARDMTVEKIKGHQPQLSEAKRMERILKEKIPTAQVRLGREDGDFWETLREESPDALFLGYDQDFEEKKCQKHFPEIEILRAQPYAPEFFKSSRFKGKVGKIKKLKVK